MSREKFRIVQIGIEAQCPSFQLDRDLSIFEVLNEFDIVFDFVTLLNSIYCYYSIINTKRKHFILQNKPTGSGHTFEKNCTILY